MRFRDIKIGRKLAIGFGSLILLMIIAGYVGFNGIQTVGHALFVVGDEEAPLILIDKWEWHLGVSKKEEKEVRRWKERVDHQKRTGDYGGGGRLNPSLNLGNARGHREKAERIEQVFEAWDDIWERYKHSLKKEP